MKLFDTILGNGESELIVERSRFLSFASYVETREEADRFLQDIRSRYPDATHHVPAFVIGSRSEVQWASDNGEPQGTAGAPMLHFLTASGLTNVAVVVVRYFGGVKLGTGGLVRAYSAAARQGVLAAGLCRMEEMAVIPCETDYASYSRVSRAALPDGMTIQDPAYAENVRFLLVTDEARLQKARDVISELTGGKAVFGEPGKTRRRVPYTEEDAPVGPR